MEMAQPLCAACYTASVSSWGKCFSSYPVRSSLISNLCQLSVILPASTTLKSLLCLLHILFVGTGGCWQVHMKLSLLQVEQALLPQPLRASASVVQCLSYCGAQNHPPQFSIQWAGQRGLVASLGLLVMLLFIQPKMLLSFSAVRAHGWLTCSLLSSIQSVLSLCHCQGLQNIAFLLDEFHKAPVCPEHQPEWQSCP